MTKTKATLGFLLLRHEYLRNLSGYDNRLRLLAVRNKISKEFKRMRKAT